MAIEVRAQITGTVWKVLVQVGQRVVEEETVVILESMKMEIPVEAPAGGSILAVHVSEGDSIEDGMLIVTLE